jgi:hypothetical protein
MNFIPLGMFQMGKGGSRHAIKFLDYDWSLNERKERQ